MPPAIPLTPQLPEPIEVPPPVTKPPYLPFLNLPAVPLDENNNGIGIAQRLTRERGHQGRVLWIDATANLDKVNTAEKIAALVAKIKGAGFNTIVFEVKPIIGYVLYPSKYAPKMTEWVRPWKTQTLPLEFDPLKEMTAQAKAQGIGLIINLNAFSEGHREFMRGPGFDNPQWQTILYEPDLRVRRDIVGAATYPVMDRPNMPSRRPDDLAVYTNLASLKQPAPTTLLAILDKNGVVQAQVTAAGLGAVSPAIPSGGSALVATAPQAIEFLRQNALPGERMTLDNLPAYVPSGQRPDRQVPLMTNPHSPEVRQRLLNILTEIATNYEVDGFIFDDRLRYASLNADFSEAARQGFERYVGKAVRWPDDVFRFQVDFPTMERHEVPGPLYDAWLTFRALTIRNFLAEVIRTVKTIRPTLTVGTYVGSWYPDYPDIGANWGADDLLAGFRFLNDSYRRTGWAGMVDYIMTGCYYDTASLAEAAEKGINIGESVEAAGQFSNRAVNDQTFVYAGLQLDKFKNKPEELKRCLQAAAATTQGIMVFDLSHDFDLLLPVFTEAFQKPVSAPHQVPGLLSELRSMRTMERASGIAPPPVILYRGASGTGF
jgi:uncharacterized lipoprotein YddW (UPF0748 family)